MKLSLVSWARQAGASFVVALSIGWGMPLSLTQAAHGLGTERTTLPGNMLDCSDSGMLVGVSIKDHNNKLGKCPLKHTDVSANISGYVARVTVKQQFHNPFNEKIEAVYTFPLPENAAVDEMTMKVGNRVIKGEIKKREEAREIYDNARARGNVASLLDQERANIFTQSVANIEPGQNIDVEIKYVNLLKYEDGSFTFNFPTVVGPRFIPGTAIQNKPENSMAANTFEVPDASKITPPAAAPGERAGHDIAINLNINAGVPIQSVQSKLHDVLVERNGANTARIRLKDHDKIPNKDFVATWTVAADAVQSGYLTHRQGSEGFVTLMMIPPKRVTPEKLQPKEMIFVIDCSGSQNGRPIQKAKETMNYILDHMNPNDTFQIITFNSGVSQFAEHPEVASSSMRERAHKFVDELQAMGGTWMAPAVEKACSLPNDEHRLRIITFMTDGYVGNDMEILGMIKKYRGQTRWFPFGTGNAVNRFLIDGIAKEGGGEPEYVLLNSSAEEVGKKFYERISSPVLTDIKIEFDGTRVKDVYPKDLVDLWAQKPLYFTGRYTNAGSAKVVLTGYSAGKPYRQEMKLDLPEEQIANEVLPSIWARAKVERLMHEDWKGAQSGHMNPEIKEDIVNTALKYHIMSQYTSFVAVEEDRSTGGAAKKTVPVKVETPDGVNQEPQSYGKLLRRSVRHSASTGSYLGSGSLAPPPPPSNNPASAARVMRSGQAYSSANMGLPQTNMNAYIRQPGDGISSSGVSAKSQSGAAWYKAPKQLQIVDERPIVQDSRPSAQDAQRIQMQSAPTASYGAAPPSYVAPSPYTVPVSSYGASGPHSSKIQGRLINNKGSNANPGVHSDLLNRLKTTDKQDKLDARSREILAKKKPAEQVMIEIDLSVAAGSDLLERLHAAGLDIRSRKGTKIYGKISAANIQNLIKLTEVLKIKLTAS